jgi:SAM-dependent methyltransferase
MAGKKITEDQLPELSLKGAPKKAVLQTIKQAFNCFVDFEALKKKRKPFAVKMNSLHLSKNLTANKHDSSIENCGTDFMLEGFGRGMMRFSRRFDWLYRHYEWAQRVPVIPNRRARIVDLGCDVGEIRKIMSSSFYYKNPLYVGVDLDHTRLMQGFQAIVSARTPAMYVQHDMTYPLGFIKSGTVDCVFFGEVIEHFEQKYAVKVLKEIKRILRPKGRFFISTPNARNTVGKFPFHIREYSPPELRTMVKEAGLGVIRVYGWSGTEKTILKNMSKEHRKFYDEVTKNMSKDLVMSAFCHMDVDVANAFCLEGAKPPKFSKKKKKG